MCVCLSVCRLLRVATRKQDIFLSKEENNQQSKVMLFIAGCKGAELGSTSSKTTRRRRRRRRRQQQMANLSYDQTSKSTTMTTARRQSAAAAATTYNLASCYATTTRLLPILLLLCLSHLSLVSCTPPVDFLVYTGQLAATRNGDEHKTTPILHSIDSIYNSLLAYQTTANQDNNKTQQQQEDLKQLASKVLAIIKNVGHKHSSDQAANLEITRYAWQLMEKQALKYAHERVASIKPAIKELLVESQASRECQESLLVWLDRFAELDDWAVMMWNSWGDFPASGLFEGSFTDLGSYKSCLNVEDNQHIGQAQYCTLDLEPIVPTRPRFHSIFKRILGVDPATRQLTGGDFSNLHPTEDKPRSQTASHRFAASRHFNVERKESKATNQSQFPTEEFRVQSSAFEELAKVSHYFYYVKLRVGSCWPSKCSRSDIQNIVQSAGAFAILRTAEPFCTKRNENMTDRMNKHQVVAAVILAGLAMLAVAATCLEAVRDLLFFFSLKRQSNWITQRFNLYIDTYSLCRNSARLFDVSGSKVSMPLSTTTTTMTEGKRQELPAKQLTCLHGLKFISMIWVIYGHTLLFSDYQSYSHPMRVIEGNIASIWTFATLTPNFSVDTFFVISGLLSAYIIFSLDVKFNGILYTIARYIRLTPQLVIVILLFFLLPLMGEGPIYKQGTEVHSTNCMNHWWLNLLYLQSYVNRQEICLVPSWWLSIEMTFHLISLFVIHLLFKNPKIGMLANVAVIIVMTLAGSVYHYANGFAIQYLPSIPQKYEIELEQTQYFFHMPYPHAPSFFIGLALGYVLAKHQIRRIQSYQLYLGWSAFTAIFAICLLGSYHWNLGAPHTQLEATIYYNLCQVLWPLGISWLILTCTLGQGGIVNSILSADFFIPFGRITYMTYLSHMVVVYYYAASIQQTFEPNFLNMTYMCTTNGILSIILGAILSLVYEAPLLNIQRLILQRTFGGKKKEPISMKTSFIPVYYLFLGLRYFLPSNLTSSTSMFNTPTLKGLLLFCHAILLFSSLHSSRLWGSFMICLGSGCLIVIVDPSLKTRVVGYRRAYRSRFTL